MMLSEQSKRGRFFFFTSYYAFKKCIIADFYGELLQTNPG